MKLMQYVALIVVGLVGMGFAYAQQTNINTSGVATKTNEKNEVTTPKKTTTTKSKKNTAKCVCPTTKVEGTIKPVEKPVEKVVVTGSK